MRPVCRSIFQLETVPESRTKEFIDRTAKALGIRFPLEYVSRSQALMLSDQAGNICGGLLVVTDQPFRSLQAIPQHHRASVTKELGSLGDIAEVNGLWIAAEKKSVFVSISFWRQMTEVLLQGEKDRFLFTVDNQNHHMLSHVSVVKPDVLFSGETKQLDGMGGTANESILCVHRLAFEAFVQMLDRRDTGNHRPEDANLIRQVDSRRQSALATNGFETTRP